MEKVREKRPAPATAWVLLAIVSGVAGFAALGAGGSFDAVSDESGSTELIVRPFDSDNLSAVGPVAGDPTERLSLLVYVVPEAEDGGGLGLENQQERS